MESNIPNNIPQHVAIIMDGNGRWARARMMPRVEGHRQGAKALKRIVKASRELGIRYLTVYAFSTENWKRPEAEVSSLMKLFISALNDETPELKKNNVRLRAMGALDMLPKDVQEKLYEAMDMTKDCDALDLIIAVSYGGRYEICDACKKLLKDFEDKKISIDEVNENTFRNYLYLPDVPDPDFLIRTSKELRVSNFLLWQIAYSELVVSEKYWPEFDLSELKRCIDEFNKRSRRFGKTGDQIKAESEEK